MKTKVEMNQISKIVSKETGEKWKVSKCNDGQWYIINEYDECLYWDDLIKYDEQIKKSIGNGKKVF